MVYKLALALLLADISYDEPWDAAPTTQEQTAPEPTSLSQIAQGFIVFYRTHLTQTTGPRSHFRPTSSLFMLEAIQKHGFVKGYLMGCDRLMRENSEPWVYRPILDEGKRYKADLP